jgi:hypothetical protein
LAVASFECVEALFAVRREAYPHYELARFKSLVNLKMEALSSFETSVLTRATRRNISENAILHSHRRENLKSYINVI